jgi:hypothetical protein
VSLEGRVKNLERRESDIDRQEKPNVWTWEEQVEWYETAYHYEKWLYLWDLVELGKAQGTPVSDPDRLLESGLQLLLHYLEQGVVVEYDITWRRAEDEGKFILQESEHRPPLQGSVMDDPDVPAHQVMMGRTPEDFCRYILRYMRRKGLEYTAVGDVRAWLERRLQNEQKPDTKTTKSG